MKNYVSFSYDLLRTEITGYMDSKQIIILYYILVACTFNQCQMVMLIMQLQITI